MESLNGFYFTTIEANLAEYCRIELTRYCPNSTLEINYGDKSNQTIKFYAESKKQIGYLIVNDLVIRNESSRLIRDKYDICSKEDKNDSKCNNETELSLYFTGILLQHIQFDDNYWLNGFEFEALKDGIIKIGVTLNLINFL